MSQMPPPFKNEKNSKIHSTSEILPNIAVTPLSTPSIAIVDPVEYSTTTTALETHPTTVNFTEKLEKLENTSNFPPKNPPTLSLYIFEHTDNITRVHTSLQTPNDALFQPAATPTTASSSSAVQGPA